MSTKRPEHTQTHTSWIVSRVIWNKCPYDKQADCPLWREGGNSLSHIINPPHLLVCVRVCVFSICPSQSKLLISHQLHTTVLRHLFLCGLYVETSPHLFIFSPSSQQVIFSSSTSPSLSPTIFLNNGETQSEALLFLADSPFGVAKVISFLSSHSATSAAVIICSAKEVVMAAHCYSPTLGNNWMSWVMGW